MELKRKTKKVNGYTVELEIGVGHEEFEAAREQAYRKNVGKITIPGFRRGKTPQNDRENVRHERL